MKEVQKRFLIWVTSDCNLNCPLCSQRYTREHFAGYHMSLFEIDFIVQSLKSRDIRFDVIELTGGEASLWSNLEYGVRKFREVCNTVTMVTNGNNPERVIDLEMGHWLVSASQATKEQISKYKRCNVSYINHKHRKPPTEPIQSNRPALCCVTKDIFGKEQTSLLYILGMVVYCCNAFAISEYKELTSNTMCSFKKDFMYLQNKTYLEDICNYCICNKYVWETLRG